jgi:predicted HD superfamily hydrolase involved in NAD metabolism
MDEMINIQEELEKILKKKRYQHTLGVRYTAQAMAMCFGEDIKKAGYAGLLHDCAKYMSDSEMQKECGKNRITVSDAEKRQPSLLHAKLGACYARRKYGVDDRDIVEAIRWHTTGKPEMNTLEKIIFIADYIEPNRKMLPGMEQIRKASFEDLDLAMYLILKNTIAYLKETQDEDKIDTNSMQAYEYYKAVIKAR